MIRSIQNNLAFNMFYTITYLDEIFHPAMKFKIKFADVSFPEKSKSTMTLQGVLMNLEVADTKDNLTFRKAFSQVCSVKRGLNVGNTAVVHWNDSKGRRYEAKYKQFKGHRRGSNGPITSLAEKISAHPAAWLFWYMTVELEYDESTVRSAMLGVSELERHTVEMATWNSETLTVTTDMATVGGANYVNESAAMMANHGEDIDNIDFGMLVTDKEVVDDDEEEREKIIKANRLYEDGHQAKIGTSGASVRTGHREHHQ